MERSPLRIRTLIALLAVLLVVAACGSDATPVSSGSSGQEDPTAPPASNDGDDASDDAAGDEPVAPPAGEVDGTVLGTANIGGEIVDPVRHDIDEIAILESYPEQIVVAFTAGAEPCLAATATAVGDESQVTVVLDVGITTDALTKSCLAGEFENRLTIPLTEGLDGRPVVVAAGEERPAAGEPPPQAFETTLIGLSEQSAEEAAANFGYGWRVVHRDGEDFIVTQDFIEDRINAFIVDGVVTQTFLG